MMTAIRLLVTKYNICDTVLPRNQAHVRKGENTLFWVLIVVHFCSLLGACASYGMQFGMQFVRPHRTRIQTMQS